jgi:hypothetical protein
MGLRFGFIAMLAWLAPFAASAQVFANPFGDAAFYRQMRGEAPAEATYRVRYEVTRTEPNQAPATSEIVIDVAPDWSLSREGDQIYLRDFRLNRMFILQGDSFVSGNGLADIVFRVMERQNRTYLQRIASAAGVQLADDCDADAELGVTIPSTEDASPVEVVENGGAVQLRCGGRIVGRFTPSDGPTPPAAFWPTMFSAMTTHPGLHRRVRESGHPPRQLETSFRFAPDAERRRSWRLVAVEAVSSPYPLTAAMRNATADLIDREFVAGIGPLAVDAVMGRAQGGPPTMESWSAHISDVARREGDAAAAMLVMPTYNMFPELEGACATAGRDHAICPFNRNLRTIAESDPAPLALLEVAMAEQERNSSAAIAAMTRAQTSRFRDHPALNAAYALAVLRFDAAAMAEARAANLPTDVDALQASALRGLPYAPTHWGDVGDRYAAAYDYITAFVFYDVAYSLPMPSATARHRALVSKRDVMMRIRRDFPEAGLVSTIAPLPVRSGQR